MGGMIAKLFKSFKFIYKLYYDVISKLSDTHWHRIVTTALL